MPLFSFDAGTGGYCTQDKAVSARLLPVFLHVLLTLHFAAASLVRRMTQKRKIPESGAIIVLTGTFYSDNWVNAHIRPLANSPRVSRVRLVTTTALAPQHKIEIVIPPRWLSRFCGSVGSRLIMFLVDSLRSKPHLVGGFHLLFNGLAAILTAPVCRANSMYFCVGGPAEVQDGGLMSENRLFEKLGRPNHALEKKLLRAVRLCDLIITMGSRAQQFFEQQGVTSRISIASGGIPMPPADFSEATRDIDILFVGRLVEIKRLDLLLDAVALRIRLAPDTRVAIVGEGPLRTRLEEQSRQLHIEDNVQFVGFTENVVEWLARSKLFVLTSDSEGLSLALMEAMAWGLPAVVSDVGDLGDLVDNGNSGYLVAHRSPDEFADRFADLLDASEKLQAASIAARTAAEAHSIDKCTSRWNRILEQF